MKCSEVYTFEDSVERIGSKILSMHCSHVAYLQHPRASFRHPCGALLMKEVRMGSKNFFYPFKAFCYKSIIESLRELCSRTGFLEKCELWRNNHSRNNLLTDVYDGQGWKDFSVHEGLNFFMEPHNFGLMLNVDWFQTYKHTQYSVGVIYLALMNLPRSQ